MALEVGDKVIEGIRWRIIIRGGLFEGDVSANKHYLGR